MAANETQRSAVELARLVAELGDAETALKLYCAALVDPKQSTSPADRLEAACAVLQYGEDYRIAYDALLDLYRKTEVRNDVFAILTDAFYTPNMEQHENQYAKNCELLQTYPYLFRKDFLPFEDLPVQFYPYDDDGVLPYYKNEERFDSYTNINAPVIAHYFFRDLEKPVFAEEIFSRYELEYLKDSVRRSDWVGRENHIYLHYSDWGVFCAWLQLLDMKPLLEDEKFVFLIGEEKSLYPIDFKERFGIDYSQYPVKPLHIREINKLIWHTQLLAHNGGDFFNEILHGHPNLLGDDTIMLYELIDSAKNFMDSANEIIAGKGELEWSETSRENYDEAILQQLTSLENITEKDAWVALYLGRKGRLNVFCDRNSRITPALLIQPHFFSCKPIWKYHESGQIAVSNNAYQEVADCGIFQQFKYIKTFSPMRRPTTSHGAVLRVMSSGDVDAIYEAKVRSKVATPILHLVTDNVRTTIMNRNMMVADDDRLYQDSCLVRFEDAKLNPTATFTALAEFLDIPYTESMTYCSNDFEKDPLEFNSNVRGFDPAPVYRTYDEFADDNERILIEYLMRDIYQHYGYSFQYYDGRDMTPEDVENLLEKCTTNLGYIEKKLWSNSEKLRIINNIESDKLQAYMTDLVQTHLAEIKALRLKTVRSALCGLSFCSNDGKPLHFMKKLEPIPELLEQPLYH